MGRDARPAKSLRQIKARVGGAHHARGGGRLLKTPTESRRERSSAEDVGRRDAVPSPVERRELADAPRARRASLPWKHASLDLLAPRAYTLDTCRRRPGNTMTVARREITPSPTRRPRDSRPRRERARRSRSRRPIRRSIVTFILVCVCGWSSSFVPPRGISRARAEKTRRRESSTAYYRAAAVGGSRPAYTEGGSRPVPPGRGRCWRASLRTGLLREPAKSPQASHRPSSLEDLRRCVDAIQRCVSHAGLHESIASMGAASSKSSRESTSWSCIGANPFAALFAEVPKADVSETKPPAPEADECSD